MRSWIRTGGIALIAVVVAHAADARAANFVVNSLDEPGDGTCDASHCTLREAVDALSSSSDQVLFDFSSLSAPFTVELDAPLVVAQSGVLIDGLVCTGCGTVQGSTTTAAAGFDSALAVRVVASGSFAGDALVSVTAANVTLRGLNLDGSDGDGIEATGDDLVVEDCFIGTSISGGAGLGNAANGISVDGATGLVVGPGNVISGNGAHGVYIEDNSDAPTITGNIIGLDRTGQVPDGNAGIGVYLDGRGGSITIDDPTIGGPTPADGNVIAANTSHGILIQEAVDGSGASLIGNNVVGLNGSATAVRGNGGDGVRLLGGTGNGSEPEGLVLSENVIGGNVGSGIHLQSAILDVVSNNWIGTNTGGVASLGNLGSGIYLFGAGGKDTKQHVIGGANAENVIAFNVGDGIRLKVTASANVKENRIAANSIYENGGIGIDIEAAASGDGAGSPAPNTCANSNAWGNRQASAPILTSANLAGGALTVAGTACANATVDVYLASVDGEPKTYLGTGTAGAAGAFLIAVPVLAGTAAVDATALQTDGDDETGEAATAFPIASVCDADGDSVDGAPVMGCSGPDCDDNDPTIYPGAPEVCDGVDSDCDGSVPATETDDDSDGVAECEGDCDDTLATVNPTAPEVCDGLDNDCDTVVPLDEVDNDGDTFDECADGDCDDTDPTVFDGAPEICDGLDNDCNGAIPSDETDDDGDTFDECADGDCDDLSPTVFPGATEACNGVDDDCDGVVPVDELDGDSDGVEGCAGDCDDADPDVRPGAPEICDGEDSDCDGTLPADEADSDGDGAIVCDDSDCDDTDPTVYAGAPELCDGVDNDCDEVIDEVEDLDADGFSNCDGDCDDSDGTVNPDAEELCDGVDTNCDGNIGADELDADQDGFLLCDGGDCDDADPSVNAGAEDVCDDGIDQDCDGADDPCEQPCDDEDVDEDGTSECDGDCNDADPSVGPQAPEICGDDLDQDCDGADASCVELTLGAVPDPGCDCAADLAASGQGTAGFALLFAGLFVRRRRRSASGSLRSAAALGAALALAGCADVGGGTVQTWWGTVDGVSSATFEAGGGFVAGAVAQPVEPSLVNNRSVVEVILGGDRHPLTCDGLQLLAAEMASVELGLLESIGGGGSTAELAGWACQELRGVAREVFGGDDWHAIHALLEPGADPRARPAADAPEMALVPGVFIGKIIDLSGPGGLAPEPGEDGCAARVAARLEAGPLEPGFLAQSAVSRLAHRAVPAETLQNLDLGATVQVGLEFPEGTEGVARDGTVNLTGFARPDSAGAFDTIVFSTEGTAVASEPCTAFELTRNLAWPELVAPEETGELGGGDR
jgi:MYXO-CTERM domain-containing protein